MFDAYTIKKVLPRLVIAIILIQLSWFIFTEMIHLVNLVAYGVEGLVYAPFGGRDALAVQEILSSISDNGVEFTWTGLAVGAAAASWALGIFGLLSLGFTIILALLIGVFLLSLRRLLIVALLILSPIALVAWILPGTEKVWKVWWESFSKLLYVYPIVLLLFAVGRAFGKVAAAGSTTNTVKIIVVMLAIYGPFFLIPKVFQIAGSAFANLAGIVNNTSRGIFDRNKKYRGQKIAENMQKTRNYQRFSDRNMLTRGLNAGGGLALNPKRDLWRAGRGGLAAGRNTGRTLQGLETFKNDAIIQANQNDDNFLMALANEDLARSKLRDAERRLKAESDPGKRMAIQAEINARKNGLNNAQAVASRKSSSTRIAALNALAKTGYQFSAGQAGYNELSSTVQSIVGNDQGAYLSAMNEAQFHLKGAGRLELAGINHGASNHAKGGIRKLGNYGRGQGKTDTYLGGAEAWLGDGAITADGKTTTESLHAAMNTSFSSLPPEEAASSISEWHSMLLRDMSSASDVNKLEIQKQISAMESWAASGAHPAAAGVAARLNANREALRSEGRGEPDPSVRDAK